ncbi:hypothetical protein B0T17DRAFT_616591 [Bombardia bombarda]|uniref:Zn(2)-C6 fungal-type domain-containing protein n=1 Tax=Bombardia bombarda TaxID=252184 RepID=A0AA39XBS7_9PEZI|nr:hypothetical protein B0T17DRAFT_616591 [Bombardia bombarda]
MERKVDRQRGKPRVKSGCGTCKIRKVKCDESRPACQRCITTGRVCEGYGIWGGGGNRYGPDRHPFNKTARNPSRQGIANVQACSAISVVPRAPASTSVLVSGEKEISCFEWFVNRTAPKLPGTFSSRFWNTLIIPASLNEPAISHAVLALSSVHKRGIAIPDSQRNDPGVDAAPGEQEEFILQHFAKAISSLALHSSSKDRASFRIALITCIVFVCLDYLRGELQTALLHLRHGLRILGQMQILSCNTNEDGSRVLCLKQSRDLTDEWIVEAFSRLNLQVQLFRHPFHHHHPYPVILQVVALPDLETIVAFTSIKEAWEHMTHILNRVMSLTHQARERERMTPSPHREESIDNLLQHQQTTRRSLSRWSHLFDAFQGNSSAEERVPSFSQEELETVHLSLRVHHTMASIMAETCLQPGDESVFDSHTSLFLLLLKQSARMSTLAELRNQPVVGGIFLGKPFNMSGSVVDLGWIAPLYYTAIKCRVHRIRLQAIRFLESQPHREGIWDARITSCIARKIMRIEEQGLYEGDGIQDDFSLGDAPQAQDLGFKVVPEYHRVSDVQVVMSGAPMDKVLLSWKRKHHDNRYRLFSQEYDLQSQRWTELCPPGPEDVYL